MINVLRRDSLMWIFNGHVLISYVKNLARGRSLKFTYSE